MLLLCRSAVVVFAHALLCLKLGRRLPRLVIAGSHDHLPEDSGEMEVCPTGAVPNHSLSRSKKARMSSRWVPITRSPNRTTTWKKPLWSSAVQAREIANFAKSHIIGVHPRQEGSGA